MTTTTIRLRTAADFNKKMAEKAEKKLVEELRQICGSKFTKLRNKMSTVEDEDLRAYSSCILEEIFIFANSKSRPSSKDGRNVKELIEKTKTFFDVLSCQPLNAEDIKNSAEEYTEFLKSYGSKWRSAVNVVTKILKYVALIICALSIVCIPYLLHIGFDANETFAKFLRLDNCGVPITRLANQAKDLFQAKAAFFKPKPNTRSEQSTPSEQNKR